MQIVVLVRYTEGVHYHFFHIAGTLADSRGNSEKYHSFNIVETLADSRGNFPTFKKQRKLYEVWHTDMTAFQYASC